ncbi:hypothetical protein M0R45_037310 [Rubus argutus]|uniref:Uncharacterized protein n=1 Tax=Rubus argutus TaxID=59490 RepID=A0AAW1W1Y4_RUBAR
MGGGGGEGHAIGIDLGTTYSNYYKMCSRGKSCARDLIRMRQSPMEQAVQAAVLKGHGDGKLQDLTLLDVTPLSLGLESVQNRYARGIHESPKNVPKFNVCFDIDASGILRVSAEDMTTGQRKEITINRDRRNLGIENVSQSW